MTYYTSFSVAVFVLLFSFATACQSQDNQMEPEETEVWEPVPEKIDPGTPYFKEAPGDAIVLFGGDDVSKWEHPDGSAVQWTVEDGVMTVNPGTGGIQTKQNFGSVQLHIEWRAPEPSGEGQDRGNSGVFFQNRYEVQVLDSYNNETYSNGMAGSIYKQYIPRVNAALPPGEWQTYDIVFEAPEFNDDGSVEKPGYLTLFWNGVIVQNKVELKGPTEYIGIPEYEAYEGGGPLALQDHSHTVSYRNIWIREIQ